MVKKEIKAIVQGRVQGVNFRNTVKKKAESLDLKGYVLNRESGEVEIIAQGPGNKLNELVDWIKSSPGFSKVGGIQTTFQNGRADYNGFSIIKERGFFLDQAKSFLNLGKSLIIEKESKVPKHVVIIPDGNRRWARNKGLDASFGHYTAGSKDHVISLIDEARLLGVEYLTLWGFSTENWKRDSLEINAIFDLVQKILENAQEYAINNKVRFRHFGRKDRLPSKLVSVIKQIEEKTKDFNSFNVQICLDYGGRDEIIRAVNKILKSGVKEIDENGFSKYLDSEGVPDPDLIIRTSGEKRTSGIMPFQSAYSEFYFSDLYFPDFDIKELRKAIGSFGGRVRRFGATARQDLK